MVSQETLISNKRYLESEMQRLQRVLKQHPYPGIATVAGKEFERGDTLNVKQIERFNHQSMWAKLKDCEIALKKMGDGTYGICIDCGEEINDDRVQARPEASRCKGCQEKKGLRVR